MAELFFHRPLQLSGRSSLRGYQVSELSWEQRRLRRELAATPYMMWSRVCEGLALNISTAISAMGLSLSDLRPSLETATNGHG